MVNSLYDPLEFADPVSIQGKAILKELTTVAGEWDDPLPEDKRKAWSEWKESLYDLQQVRIKSRECTHSSLCIFSDALTQAIGAVACLKVTDDEENTEHKCKFAKAKLAPQPDVTIPRLELCAAVLAVTVADMINEEMDVLGYIQNESRKLYVYVNSRMQRIRKSSSRQIWIQRSNLC